ncbi:hypothetical protein PR048_023663, partial [Dryococelus australis]
MLPDQNSYEALSLKNGLFVIMGSVNYMIVWRILQENLLYTYHFQQGEGLNVADSEPRHMLQQCAVFIHFFVFTLFTKEVGRTCDSIANYHNSHTWPNINPHDNYHQWSH